jgi:putative ABC transport system permease protein
MDLLRSLLPPGLPRGDEVRLDGRVAWFAMALSLATTVAFGLLPALKCSKINLVEGLAGSSASLGGRRGKGARVWLVVAETALALVLAAGAGLMMNSFVRLMRLDLGMDPKNLLAVSVWPGQRVHPLQRGAYHAFEPALEATRSVPGVKQAGAVEVAAPLMGGGSATEIRPKPTSPGMLIDCKAVDGAYFGTLGISLRAGRVFTSQDTDRSASVVVVNESLARMLYPAGGAVGRPLGYSTKPSTIVGVVADVRNRVLFPPGPEVYRPATQMGGLRMPTLVVRYEEAGKANVNALIRQRLSELDPTSIIQIRSFEEAIAQQGLQTRFLTALIAGLGALGLLLAASGVFGVTAYGVNRRTRELGVRLAIGAAPGDVLRMIVREAVVMALAGAAIGTAAVVALSSVLRNLLFEVPPGDPLTLLAVIGVLAAVTIAASYVPARRVLKIDPATALRHE